MSKLQRVLFHPAHIDLAEIRSLEKNGLLDVPDLENRLKALEHIGDAATLMYDGRIVGFIGFVEMWPGVCDIWLLPTIYIKTASRPIAVCIKRYLCSLSETFKFHRIQTVAPDDELHRRWMIWLGFEVEGVLKEYSQTRKDYIQWARIYKWD